MKTTDACQTPASPPRIVNRATAAELLRKLAHGLGPDDECARRLLERIASHDEADALRSALVELGASALLGTLWATRTER